MLRLPVGAGRDLDGAVVSGRDEMEQRFPDGTTLDALGVSDDYTILTSVRLVGGAVGIKADGPMCAILICPQTREGNLTPLCIIQPVENMEQMRDKFVSVFNAAIEFGQKVWDEGGLPGAPR
jgi:hypothetical protein